MHYMISCGRQVFQSITHGKCGNLDLPTSHLILTPLPTLTHTRIHTYFFGEPWLFLGKIAGKA